jgi:hypothetical protein
VKKGFAAAKIISAMKMTGCRQDMIQTIGVIPEKAESI